MMDEVNRIRRSLGLTELQVDPYLVFTEVLEADINDVPSQEGHSSWQRSKDYSWGDLAWGYSKTSAVKDAWYGEKAEFDEFIKTHPTVTLAGKTYELSLIGTPQAPGGLGYAFSMAYPEEFGNVGHYLSIVSTNSKYMGGGFVTKSNTAALLMGNGGRDSTYTVPQTFYTVAEWRAKVQAGPGRQVHVRERRQGGRVRKAGAGRGQGEPVHGAGPGEGGLRHRGRGGHCADQVQHGFFGGNQCGGEAL